jgi:hypothetical protein
MPYDHSPTDLWLRGSLSNLAYLLIINHAAGTCLAPIPLPLPLPHSLCVHN